MEIGVSLVKRSSENIAAVGTCWRGWMTTNQLDGKSTAVNSSPTPSAKAFWPKTNTGTSAPSERPIRISSARGSRTPQRWFSASSVVAASDDPPPMPPPIGSCLSMAMSAPNCVPLACCKARAARTTRSVSAGTPGMSVVRAITPSSRR
ncbi:hypothetical protein D3C86_1623790 [compost metagenome]